MPPQRKRSYLFIGLILSASIAVALVDGRTARAEKAARAEAIVALRAEQEVTTALIRERELSEFRCVELVPIP